MKYYLIILFCLCHCLKGLSQEFGWLTALIDSIENETTLCADCPESPEIKSYFSSGEQRFRLRYSCSPNTSVAKYFDENGFVFGVCIVEDNFRDCEDVSAYTSFTFGTDITTFWSCEVGTLCTEEQRLNLFKEYEIVTLDDPCDVTTKELSISESFEEYLWILPNGDLLDSTTIKIKESGIYIAVVTNENGCSDTSNVVVNINSEALPQILGDTVICDSSGTNLSITGYTAYLWSNGETSSTSQFYDGGQVSVLLTDQNQCVTTAFLQLQDLSGRDIEITVLPDIVYENQSILISYLANWDLDQQNILEELWYQDGNLLNAMGDAINVKLKEQTIIRIELYTLDGCMLSDEIVIDPQLISREFYAPNVFMPGSLGVNDRFFIQAPEGTININSLKVYDRWGGIIFERITPQINDAADGWDGTSNGQLAPVGIYTFKIDMTLLDGSVEVKTGNVLLMR